MALVRILATSEPAVGSVTPRAEILFPLMEDEKRAITLGELRLLLDANTLLSPVQYGRDEEVDVEAVIVVEVDASPYLAWFSMPVPVQHQKESRGVL